MSKNSNTGSSSGVGFVSLLQLLLIGLKLAKIIDWSWICVLAPTWIEILIVSVIFYILNS